jgi:hypothetical protein
MARRRRAPRQYVEMTDSSDDGDTGSPTSAGAQRVFVG